MSFCEVLKVIDEIYPELNTELHQRLLQKNWYRVVIYANDNLLPLIDEPYLRLLQANMLIHFFIADPDSGEDFYGKYKMDSQDFLVTSVSSAGASTSIQPIPAVTDGDFLTLDLYRTPFGRTAYQMLSALKGVALL